MADPPERSFSESDEEIMRATYRALREHGYADLTIKRIAEEYGKSTAAVHYHYETKDELLAAFLDYILDRFVETVRGVETINPAERLELLLNKLLVEPAEHYDLLVSMLEMESQAPYNGTFRERFQQNDEYIGYMLETAIERGIKEGTFPEVDAEHVATTLLTIANGARTRAVVLEDLEALGTGRRAAEEYVDSVLSEGSERGS
ncbi:TetR/AcrR family transcriptional regulator [Natronomonas sp. F2-12]|jgi:AcrR family transcriptional regulator|uniref:TetR/AcrR family transcriptional regulator n=1 Tax=Natronomonas aquatica TaxID=2841590 RepID=A0A9R1CS68_9EURY|nr:TetR/AcrR family transcriptional regulator [Natronomonas aquatica]MCQ4332853.1 TetR/AcrR family transcriptional regulator [Natronomonas aquatica]